MSGVLEGIFAFSAAMGEVLNNKSGIGDNQCGFVYGKPCLAHLIVFGRGDFGD